MSLHYINMKRLLGSILVFAVLTANIDYATGHGMMLEPPNRSSMWRQGYSTPPNYNDMENFCGGRGTMMANGGRCGECGDNWKDPRPRANENGGLYGRGIVVRRYRPGQVVHTITKITANHKGFLEFRLCPLRGPAELESEDCFDGNLLGLEQGGTRYQLPHDRPADFHVGVVLPNIRCDRCVLQWRYVGANQWGICTDGSTGNHCGVQEVFRGCADIAVD